MQVDDDATPAYPTFIGSSGVLPLPLKVSVCTVATQPAIGATSPVNRTFTNALAPEQVGLYKARSKSINKT